jgi:RHS repeat-associated protein
MWNRMHSRLAQLLRVAAVVFSLWITANAWAVMYASPNPSTDGSYTVYWDYGTGCYYNEPWPGWVTFECWYLMEIHNGGGQNLSASGWITQMSFSGKSVGTYTYELHHTAGDINGGYDEVLQSVVVDVVAPVNAHFSINDVSVSEGGQLAFTVTKNNTAGVNVSVTYEPKPFSAGASDFYGYAPQVLTFTPSETQKVVYVTTIDDNLWERTGGQDQYMYIELSNPTGGATISDFYGNGTILDNDPAPQFWISDASATEGGNLNFTISKSGNHEFAVGVGCAYVDGSATLNFDYQSAACNVSFSPSDTQRVTTLPTVQNIAFEPTEQMYFNLSSPDMDIEDGQGVGTIYDDDPVPTFTVVPTIGTVTEGSPLQFRISLSGNAYSYHNITYATSGSATAPGDYTATSNTVNMLAGGSLWVDVPTANDALFENQETVIFTISNPSGGAVLGSPNSATGYINSDDATPTFSMSSVTGAEGTVLQFSITQTGQSQYAHGVSYQTANTTASAPADYTSVSGALSNFVAGVPQTVNVPTAEDIFHEGNEVFAFSLNTPTNGAIISTPSANGTIDDDQDDAVAGSALIYPAANTTGHAPGSTAGALSVDATGNASYNLPIVVPPGTAGMQPELALAYNSGGGNGHVGVGWGMGGLSVITRCPPTPGQDAGSVDGIDYDAGDRFCLDGQRLIVISGTYGTNGAEYRTEIDQFAQIHSFGAVAAPGSGPQYFRIRTKAGRILYYGNTADSAVEVGPGQTTIRAWALNKVEDIVGNYMTFSYQDQSLQTDVEPQQITYTMHNTAGGAAAFARVLFEYEAREAYGPIYQGGWPITNTTRRLKSIKTEAIQRDPVSGASLGWALVRDYRLGYGTGTAGVSRLTSVQECPVAGACLPPTTFGWWGTSSAPTLAATTVSWPAGAVNANGAPLLGDFNGDGRTDLLMQDDTYQPGPSDGVSRLYLANASGAQVETWTAPTGASPAGWHKWDPAPDANLNQLYTGDFNGDGLTDIARVYLDQTSQSTYGVTVYFHRSTGTAMESTPVSTLALGGISVSDANSDTFQFADFNGDGRTDLMFNGSVGIAGVNGAIASLVAMPAGQNAMGVPGDFDGDGRVDALVAANPYWQFRLSNGSGLEYVAQFTDSSYTPANSVPAVADFNGDGLDDVLLLSGTTARVYYSKGDGQVVQGWTQTGVYKANVSERIYLGDWNNDGRADLAYHNSAGTNLSFYLSTTAGGLQLSQTVSWANPVNGGSNVLSGDWNGDGFADLWSKQPSSNSVYLTSTTGRDLVNQVTDGLGVVTTIAYAPMTDPTVYSKGATAATYPDVVAQSTRPLVKTITTDDGVSGTRSISHVYERSVANLQRRGGYGFAKVTITDNQTNIREVANYSQTYPFIGMPTSTERWYNSVLLQSAAYTLGGAAPTFGTAPGGVYFPFVQQHTLRTYEPNEDFSGNGFVAKATTTNVFDAYGNPTSVTAESFETDAQPTGEFKIATLRDFYNDTTNWLIGQLICERTRDPAVATTNRTVGFEYATALPYRGLLTKEVVEPGVNGDVTEPSGVAQCVGASPAGTRENVTLITTYTHDLFGNPSTVTTNDLATAVGGDKPARVTTIDYGESSSTGSVVAANGRFPIQVTNSASHSEYLQYDGRYGALLQVRDANNQVTKWFYDVFGRQETELQNAHSTPDFIRTDLYRAWCTAATCPHGGKLKALQVSDGAPPAAVESDRLGRVAATMQVGFNGKTTVSRTEYTSKGEMDRVSRPYFHDLAPTSIRWVDYTYDAIGRVISEAVPSDAGTATTTMMYEPGVPDSYAFRVSTTNAAGQITREQYHVRGLVDRVYTAAGTSVQSDTQFTFDLFGNVTKARVNGVTANDVDSTFDIRGRKLSMRDKDLAPQSGTTWQYRYFSFGEELRTQTDAKAQVTTLDYDVLGRPVSRAETEGTTSWFYDAAGKPKGAVDRIEAPGINKYFHYDALMRHYKTTTQVTGSGAGAGSYDVTRNFDSIGRVDTITYPASTAYPLGLQARYEFNTSGYLNRVRNLSTGAAYYTLDTVTAEGQLEQMTFGNGIKTQNLYHASSGNLDEIRTGPGGGSAVQNFHFDFSTIGNLAYRADANAGVGERLTAAGAYDAQNRLTSVQRIAHTADHTSGAVQATTSFTYNALGNLLTKGGITGTYNYAATPQTSCPAGYTTTPGPHAVRRTGSSSTNYRHYCYDRNGNQTQGWNYVLNRQRTQTWTSYNLPASITENGTSIAFSYGADRQRFRQVNGFTGTTTIYVEGLFDREVTGALVNDVHYILANGQAVATFSSRSDAVTSTRYLHRDHVGSVTHVTNETGTLVDSFAYDAWGARRNPSNWQDYAGQPPAPLLRQPQFTGHEGLHDVGIVHMNGRIYDPKLGRVLSADPFVQFAGDGQSYNRYSYALNNPLAYTDPSGFLAERVCFLSGCGAAGSARVGAIGSGSSRPAIGVTRTMWFGGGWSGGFSVPLYNSGWGAGTTCPSGMQRRSRLFRGGCSVPVGRVGLACEHSRPNHLDEHAGIDGDVHPLRRTHRRRHGREFGRGARE